MYRLVIYLLCFPFALSAQTAWDSVTIKTKPVNERISYLEGRGGNIGVLHGPEGIMLIDDQYAQLSEKIKAALTTLSSSPLRFIVNTHYHGDHTGGNENLSSDGAVIVAHHNVRQRLSTPFYSTMWERDVEAVPAANWPVITFSDNITFFLNGEEVQATYLKNAHTDGDALVYFKTSNILHAGDAFVRYGYPFIDVSAGGTIDGFIAAQEKILSIADQNTQIIPGHGQLSGIADVQELLKMLRETRDIVARLKASGQTLDEALSANPLAAYHARWSGSFINSDLFVRLIWQTIP
ncbi:MAG: MBL fold metallo-hydrolase [Cyclobacteriaceae bacterium]|nr:MBL fold metallo-hydrolase [Cyclobacteriaceae bacterium]